MAAKKKPSRKKSPPKNDNNNPSLEPNNEEFIAELESLAFNIQSMVQNALYSNKAQADIVDISRSLVESTREALDVVGGKQPTAPGKKLADYLSVLENSSPLLDLMQRVLKQGTFVGTEDFNGISSSDITDKLSELVFSSDEMRHGIEAMLQSIRETQEKQHAATVDINERISQAIAPLEEWKNKIAGIGSTLETYIHSPLALGVTIAVLLTDAFKDLSDTTASFRKEFGSSYQDIKQIQEITASVRSDLADIGVSLDDVSSVTSSVFKEFGNLDYVTEDVVSNLARLQELIGLSSDDGAKLLNIFTSSAGLTMETASNLVAATVATADLAGVAPKEVLSDIAGSSEIFAKYSSDAAESIAEAAIKARTLGINLSQVETIASNLLDFESSLTSQFEAELFIGRKLNLERARALAFTGDYSGLLDEVIGQVGSLNELNQMNVFEVQKLSQALGISADTLKSMVRNRELNERLLRGELSLEEAIQQGLSVRDALGEERLATMEKLMASLKAVGVQLIDALLPLAEILEPVLRGIAKFLSYDPIQFVLKWGGLVGITGLLTKGFLGLGKGILSFAALPFKLISGGFSKLAAAGADAAGSIVGGAGTTNPSGGFLQKFNGSAALKGAASMLIVAGAVFVFAKAMQEFASVEWESVGKGATGTTILVGAVAAISRLQGQLVTGAAAMGVMALALIPLAKAFQMFENVSAAQILKITGAIAVLGVTITALGAGLATGIGAVAFAAGLAGIIALSAALLPLSAVLKSINANLPTIDSFTEKISLLTSKKDDINMLSAAFQSLGRNIASFATFGLLASPIISAVSTSVPRTESSSTDSPGNSTINVTVDNSDVVNRLDRLERAILGMKVYVDGKPVGGIVSSNAPAILS